MKNKIGVLSVRVFGIIAILVLITFSMAACSSNNGNESNENGDVTKPDNGQKTPDNEQKIPDNGQTQGDGSIQGNTLKDQLEWLKSNVQSNKDYTLTVRDDEVLSTIARVLLYDKNNITITIRGIGGNKIISGSSIFIVGSGVTLILEENITLQGDESISVVSISTGGTFIMNGGTISGNTAYGGVLSEGTFIMNGGTISGITKGTGVSGTFTMNGGTISGNNIGVFPGEGTTMNDGTISGNNVGVSSNSSWRSFTMNGGTISGNTTNGGVYFGGGTFTMNGGTISGNTAQDGFSGGGVCFSGGTFTMNGGEISGNTAQYGGGVAIGKSGTLLITNGIIYGSNAVTGKANTATDPYNTGGASLYRLDGGTGLYGYGNIYDNPSSWKVIPTKYQPSSRYYSNDTIKVVNGVLQ